MAFKILTMLIGAQFLPNTLFFQVFFSTENDDDEVSFFIPHYFYREN